MDNVVNHAMVDCETLSIRKNAVIATIGVAIFNQNAVIDKFEFSLDLQDQIDLGRAVDALTIMWWLKQHPDAQGELIKSRRNELKPTAALFALNEKIKHHKVKYVWGNGATADNAWLGTLYDDYNITKAWPYWADLCYRTVVGLYYNSDPIERTGTYHKAVDDAVTQANHFITLNRKYGLGRL